MCKRVFIISLTSISFPWVTFQATKKPGIRQTDSESCKGTKHVWAPSISSTVSHCSVSLICFSSSLVPARQSLFVLFSALSFLSPCASPPSNHPPHFPPALSRSSSPLFTLFPAVCLCCAWVICQVNPVTPSCGCPAILLPNCFYINRACFEFAQQIIKQHCQKGHCTFTACSHVPHKGNNNIKWGNLTPRGQEDKKPLLITEAQFTCPKSYLNLLYLDWMVNSIYCHPQSHLL